MAKQISKEALLALDKVDVDSGAHEVRIAEQLDRGLYLEVNKVLESLGGKWQRQSKAHVFNDDPRDAIEQVVLDGQYVDAKKEFDIFETPAELAVYIVSKLQPWTEGLKVLEPSAGRGALVRAVSMAATASTISVAERLSANCEALRALNRCAEVVPGDFCMMEPQPVYDRVVMNPPFSRQQDIRHVSHAYRWLRRGGKLAAVMAAGVMWRENKLAVEFRDFVRRVGGEFEELPEGSFKESGTMVRTVLCLLPKNGRGVPVA
jgi:predicted RNA methylase